MSMPKNLIDTNLIIRFLINDDPQKALQVEKLLKNKQAKNILLDTVVADIIWVLSSHYFLDKTEVAEKIRALVHVETIESNSFLIMRALSIWEEYNISYIDSYLAAMAELGNINFYSYDLKFKLIPSITVKEP